MGLCIVRIFQYISNKMQLYTVYLYLETALYVSGGTLHPLSGAHTTVSTASGICHNVTTTSRYRGRVGTGLTVLWMAVTVWQIPDAVDAVVCAPDDVWRYHPKHVEQFPDKINCVTLHFVGYILEYVMTPLFIYRFCCCYLYKWSSYMPVTSLKIISYFYV